ncbi:DMP19 family protein [Uruburuella testudinis]|uniref:DMP19 family protein n=1 Tax=Uruburuella testudinis TaxID=1282863 RepID=A0ABY4DUB8_9NEIS|nr:DMP19 family protein [Uruburuella testudinis]UOO82636.1 DMP19 family protein [Uruburuella testudinis]
MPKFTLPDYTPQDPAAFLYRLSDAYLAFAEAEGETAMDKLNDEQHTLLAYCYLDSQVQEGGFIQLIAAGYGEYIFMNPLADSLRRWRIKPTPKIIEQAKALYAEHGADIEALAEAGESLDNIRTRFNDFEEPDGDYYEAADEDLAAAAAYIQANPAKFIE